MTDPAKPLVGVIMGSRSDWVTMEHCATTLEELGVPHEVRIVSAHRTPDWLMEYAGTAEARGLQVIIAAAGGAAHLPGMAASKTVLPVLGVPMDATVMNGTDALLSIVQMPGGVPVGTLAVGKPGAVNHVLERMHGSYEYLFLCDNDSTVLDPDILAKAVARLEG